ncbi:mechanosensitive ion channel family protein [Mycobacterium ulcerans]|uniref:mechanosensitive ion channel domain-containing protein n=1 Tax=Mycobacterium ulcerans TaxID=1809 RepID=UPI0012DCBB65|nr:mechanosensitive ion channel family protein [Mycobacterium ulcerans]MEB3969809.1 mechanosensitive ion channel family protein [Mycobacterium ulcerans]MEB3978071.1 mechanosensitive ion channel family protein [Mycobacterium ulcerans]MEB4007349.1 mechanosensitive ion channel family protein [Mycobacterium ulcerans]MEB4416952.1 mechanosensitive ion channel family protein [Mycobacterium ulcerans]MEB4435112.1 mechanosensitive ion channel family protein [Mycobacterium ulcerans]
MSVFGSAWFYWAVGIAAALPVLVVILTEVQRLLRRRQSALARQVGLLRNYVLPLGALLLLLVNATGVPAHDTAVRLLATVFGFLVLVLLLSGFNAAVFSGAPQGSWRRRLPVIFVDVARFVLIGAGLAVILSFVWGVRIGGLFTALGVTSVVIGLMLQNSVSQIVSGLFMLFEQPFQIDDWLDTTTTRGRIVEVNWRAVRIETGSGLRITPNSVLASTPFTNLSRPAGAYQLAIPTKFSDADAPDRVCALLSRVAAALPQLDGGFLVTTEPVGGTEYCTTIGLRSPAEESAARATFLRWIWYAARREGLHLNGADDDFSTTERVQHALKTVVAPVMRLSDTDQQALLSSARIIRFAAGDTMEYAGQVPAGMTFLITGRVRLTATAEDGSIVPVTTLHEGGFLGLTALTRQPNLAGAHALDEVTALEVDREHLEHLVMREPLLLQDFGHILEERQSKVRRVGGLN